MLAQLRLQATRVRQSRFVRDVATVATGIAAAHAISLVFSPFLTRLYGPEAFGVAAAFSALTNIIMPLATLGFANAIVMPADSAHALAVARLSLICASVVTPVLLVIVYLYKLPLARWAGLDSSPQFLYLIPISLAIGAFLSVANQSAIREGLFKPKAISYVTSNLLTNTSKLVGGFAIPSGFTLIILTLLNSVFNYVLLICTVPKKGAFEIRKWFGVSGVARAAAEQRDFALYRMPQSIINASSMGIPVLALTAFFGKGAAGQYSLAALVLGSPVMLLGRSVGEVFYPKITESIRNNDGRALTLLVRSSLVLLGISVVLFGLVAIVAQVLFPLAFGEEWRQSGRYAQWMTVWMIASLASRPSVHAIPALQIQHILLIYEAPITTARFATIYWGAIYFQDDVKTIALFSVVNAMGYATLVALAYRRCKRLQR